MNEIRGKLRKMNFKQYTHFIFELRSIAGDGWDYVSECDQEDIEEAISRTIKDNE